MIGTQAHLAAWSIRVGAAALLRHGVVVHHGIHVARRDEKAQSRTAEHRDAGIVVPVRLANDAYLVMVRLENARDDGHAERRVVDIGVAAYEHEVALIPSALIHIGTAHRQESAPRSFRLARLRRPLSRTLAPLRAALRIGMLARLRTTLRVFAPAPLRAALRIGTLSLLGTTPLAARWAVSLRTVMPASLLASTLRPS